MNEQTMKIMYDKIVEQVAEFQYLAEKAREAGDRHMVTRNTTKSHGLLDFAGEQLGIDVGELNTDATRMFMERVGIIGEEVT